MTELYGHSSEWQVSHDACFTPARRPGRASERPGWEGEWPGREGVPRFGDPCFLKREDELVRLDAAPLSKRGRVKWVISIGAEALSLLVLTRRSNMAGHVGRGMKLDQLG